MSNTDASNVLTQLWGGGGNSYPSAITPANMYRIFQLDGVGLPLAEANIWTPGYSDDECFEIWFNIINKHTDAITVNIGYSPGAAGALAVGDFWMYGEIIPLRGRTGWEGPYIIHGDDTVRGNCPTIANGGDVQWRIVRAW